MGTRYRDNIKGFKPSQEEAWARFDDRSLKYAPEGSRRITEVYTGSLMKVDVWCGRCEKESSVLYSSAMKKERVWGKCCARVPSIKELKDRWAAAGIEVSEETLDRVRVKARGTCLKCGHATFCKLNDAEHGKGCPGCRRIKSSIAHSHNHDGTTYGTEPLILTVLNAVSMGTKYKRKKYNVLCFCGNVFQTHTLHLQNGNTKSCGCWSGHSSMIALECMARIREFIPDLEDEAKLGDWPWPFDAYSEAYKLAIEFDGPTHYDPYNFHKVDIEKSKARDQRKTDYANSIGVTVLRIRCDKYQKGRQREVGIIREWVEKQKAPIELPIEALG